MTWSERPALFPGMYPNGLHIEAILDQIELLTSPPRARLRQTVAQSLSNATFTAITFDTEDFDTFVGHDTATNTSRYTCTLAGYYQFSGKVGFVGNATGRRATSWNFNGSMVDATQTAWAATTAFDVEIVAVTTEILMAVGDYVELMGYQDSGGALNTASASAGIQSLMVVRWVGSA